MEKVDKIKRLANWLKVQRVKEEKGRITSKGKNSGILLQDKIARINARVAELRRKARRDFEVGDRVEHTTGIPAEILDVLERDGDVVYRVKRLDTGEETNWPQVFVRRSGSLLKSKVKLEDRIARLKEKLGRGKSVAQDKKSSVTEGGECDMDLNNENYALPVPDVPFADADDLAQAKADAIDELPPTMLAEDVREGYKKAIRLVVKRHNKNLESHRLKAVLFDRLQEYGIKYKVATALIESVFEEAGGQWVEDVLKRADEVVDYSPETVAELGKEVELVCVVAPQEYDEEEEKDVEIEERVVEGSFKAPKVASKNNSLIGRAVPKYMDIV